MTKVSVVLHYYKAKEFDEKHIKAQVAELAGQSCKDLEFILITCDKEDALSRFSALKPRILNCQNDLALNMNRALNMAEGEWILFIDNRDNPVIMKKAAVDGFLMGAERQKDAGLFYSSYELEDNGEIKEVHLLDHHIGRVRDNMDYGKVYFIRKSALEAIGGFDVSVKYNHLYDLRLKISEKYKLYRIANRYSGSYYRVVAAGKKADVFDYLKAGKAIQLEAERVFTEHLKRIGAYMAPGVMMPKNQIHRDVSTLKASIIIPVGNRPEFIGPAIKSVQQQTVRDIEVIVMVNGGEKDSTSDVVRSYMEGGAKYDPEKPEVRLCVLDINSIGLCLNLGAKMARGKYYIQLDSDDQLIEDAVEKILAVYDSDPEIGMVIGSYEVWEKHADGGITRVEEIPVVTHDEWTDENGRNNLLRINGAGAPRSARIEVIKNIGYFSINDDPYARNYGEDYELVCKVAEQYKIGRVWDPIYKVVRHAGGTDHSINQHTIDRNDNAKDWVRMETILRRQAFNKKA
ncbi:MAG: glycosyltransferase [Candidatus Marinimicrobia bacterium]|nr:glycosyltransferase [Candidatus Neomarinimicrobiota bacterium]